MLIEGYYGTLIHNAKAQYQMYFGWFDGNPASLYQLPPEEAGKLYVRYMQNTGTILEMAQTDFDDGNYREVAMILNNVVFSREKNVKIANTFTGSLSEAEKLLAKAYTQLGYQSESGPWRNFFLAGASILRGVDTEGATLSMSDEFRLGVTIDLYFDYMAMRVLGLEAAPTPYVINWAFNDQLNSNGIELTAVSYLENGALTSRLDYTHIDSYGTAEIVTISLNKDAFSQLCLLPYSAENLDIEGIYSISNPTAFNNFLKLLDTLPSSFNIVTP